MNTWSCCCASFCVTCLEPEEGGWLSPHTLSKWESRRALAHGSIGAFWRHDFCVLALTFRTAHLFSNCGIAHSHEFFFFFLLFTLMWTFRQLEKLQGCGNIDGISWELTFTGSADAWTEVMCNFTVNQCNFSPLTCVLRDGYCYFLAQLYCKGKLEVI